MALSEGTFDAEPESYLVRIGDRLLVQVKIEFDWDSETWFGETESRATGAGD